MKKRIKELFRVQNIVWFLLISGLFFVCFTPTLRFNVKVDEVTDGTVILANYNTDRGEEIFEPYNYNGHKSWYDVTTETKEINVSVPLVTNSLQLKLDGVTDLTAKEISVNFGPLTLKTYDASNLTTSISGSQGLDISFENNEIHLHLQNTEGWIWFADQEYLPKTIIVLTYLILFLLAAVISNLLVKHVDFISGIPLNEVMLIAAPMWVFCMGEIILGNLWYISLGYRLLNVGIMVVVYKLVHLICRRRPFALNICNILFTGYAIANMYVIMFRNRPIEPWDFSALGTAVDVASNYEFDVNYMMIAAFIVCIVLYLVMRKCPRDKTRINKWYVVYPVIIIVVAIFFSSIGSYYLWDIRLLSTFQNEGTTLTFTGLVKQYIEDQPKKPDGYSDEALDKIEKEMTSDAKSEVTDGATTPTNVIVVMNESFSNLDVGGTTYASGVTPFIDSLTNTIKGNMYVSVRGGGTCNTEYETLTGNTTAFLASGVYPYNMYMNRDVPSLVSYMNQSGYDTTGIHLGKSTNWNRRTAYEKLAFQNTEFAETFDGLDTIHGYPTDEQDYEKLIEQYEANKGKKQFIFNVTYQNHGGYTDSDDLQKTVDLSSAGWGDYSAAENYLSLIKLSDSAYEKLIEYFSNVDEPTMIIMYGDHQPSLGAVSDQLFFPNSGTAEEDINEYITPFIIWANYDIPDQTIDKLSANYMSSLILKTANMQMTPYQQYLYELSQEYPVISLYGCYDKDGNFYNSVDDIDDKLITKYNMLEYNNVFDNNRHESLYWPDGKDTN